MNSEESTVRSAVGHRGGTGMMQRGAGRLAAMVSIVAIVSLSLGCPDQHKVAYKELLDEDPLVRADAATRLGQARAPDAVESLLAVLDDPSEDVRVAAAIALGQIGDPAAVQELAAKVDDPLRSVRIATCRALAEIGDPAAIEPLSRLLYEEDDKLRLVAARSIGRIKDPRAVDTLVRIALQDQDEMVRQHVIKVIGEQPDRVAIPIIESSLAGESDIVRANAAMVLGEIGDASSVPALVLALEDPYYKVRSLAAHGLNSLAPDDPEVTQVLADRLEVEDNDMVRVDIAWNLVRRGDRGPMEILRDMLFRGDPEDVRAEAAIALGEVGGKEDIPLLERALDDKKGLVRMQANEALQKLKEA
jgi:HEAT repeat protein